MLGDRAGTERGDPPGPRNRSREPKAKLPARKWASKWTIWLQDFFQTFTFFV